ncbi:4-phosphoerythronate dehydrogenase [Colwelliaceae bacterium BS250]
MKIFYDENIPYANDFFSEFGELIAFSGRDLTAEYVKDADVLLVRSITKVDQKLLHLNNKLKFVGTATIGFDHIDREYLSSRDVTFTNAPGCNAVSVAEYVLSSLLVLSQQHNFKVTDKTIGIVGGGNTGSGLTKKLDALGIKYLMTDPVLEQFGDTRKFSSLDDVLECDIISLHVPITQHCEHATYHLLNSERLSKLSTDQILVNACRGEVVDNKALLSLKQQGLGPLLVLDVWENEPNILLPLINHCELATTHIAGYSLEGKSRGTEMLYLALSKLLNKPITKQLSMYLPNADFSALAGKGSELLDVIIDRVLHVYDVRRDDQILRNQLGDKTFDYLRKNYPVRREFSALVLGAEAKYAQQLQQLGFNLNNSSK